MLDLNHDSWFARALALAALVLSICASAACASAQAVPAPAESAPYRILVTNDDGIEAPGLAALVEALAPLGEISIVAPLENKSGVGHGITLSDPIFLARREVAGRPATAVTGPPATCVRVALGHLLRETPPDLVVSGVNRGLNFGRNAYISGTVAAAREAALHGIPAIASSLERSAQSDYREAAAATAEVAAKIKQNGLSPGVFLNVNIPAAAHRGVRLARQSSVGGTETYEERRNLYGRPYLWSHFQQPSEPAEEGTDVRAVQDGYVAVSPLHATEADESALETLGELFPPTER